MLRPAKSKNLKNLNFDLVWTAPVEGVWCKSYDVCIWERDTHTEMLAHTLCYLSTNLKRHRGTIWIFISDVT